MHAAILSQYRAALAMLRRAVTECSAGLWDDPADRNAYWHIAYHALFYTHLYIQPQEADFHAWDHHRDGYHTLNLSRIPADQFPLVPYTHSQVLAYLDLVEAAIAEILPALDLTSTQSGFGWLPFGKLETQL